jgi:hypothetical protein
LDAGGDHLVAQAEENGLVKCVESLLAEKEAMAAKEKKLIEDLNAVLGKMGYRVMAAKATASTTDGGKKRGRPPGDKEGGAEGGGILRADLKRLGDALDRALAQVLEGEVPDHGRRGPRAQETLLGGASPSIRCARPTVCPCAV